MLTHWSAADLDAIKTRVPLLDFLRHLNWQARPTSRGDEFHGLCPLHRESHPSFYVNARKNLFFCHGCGRGGDLIRFLQLFRGFSFSQAIACLEQHHTQLLPDHLLQQAAAFYRLELHRHPEALQYLVSRGLQHPDLIDELGIGYAPGGNLRRHLAFHGYSLETLLHSGLINSQGRDTFSRRIIFPCHQENRIVNLYGRSIGPAFPHRLLPRSKGGLFAWHALRHCSTLILVEGLFDLAVLWQAGFRNTTCAAGVHLNPTHLQQLRQAAPQLVYIAFDQDPNLAGQLAARRLAERLEAANIPAPIVRLPDRQDPNSYFVKGATAADFTACLTQAQRI